MIKQYEYTNTRYISNNQRTVKSPDINSVKSDKVFRMVNKEDESNRPFQRKQQKFIQLRKTRGQDMRKLISNTSFGSSPNSKIFFTQQIRAQMQTPVSTQQPKKHLNRNIRLSFNYNYQKQHNIPDQIISMKELGSVQNLIKKQSQLVRQNLNNQIKILEKQNKQLKNRVKYLQEEKNNIELRMEDLNKKMEEIMQEKQNTITQFNSQLMKKIQEYEQQKEANQSLEDIIMQLNKKIQEMYQKQSIEKEQKESIKKISSKQELEVQVQSLRQKVFSMKRLLQSMQIQNAILSKFRHELQQERNHKRILEHENRSLRQKIINLIKLNQKKQGRKSGKISLKKQLQYSISFSFDK